MKRRFILPIALVLVTLAGCRAEDAILQGEIGEFCNGSDDDCREGLICLNSVCDFPGPQPLYSCEEICSHLADCSAAPTNCVANCRLTIADWSLRAKNEFAACAVGLECEEAQSLDDVPQFCYSEIDLPAERRERCDGFGQTVISCGGVADQDATAVVGACYAVARVGTDAEWEATDRCVDSQETGVCSGFATCVNDVFDLSIVLSDN